jgi:hypothetical protein
MKALTIKQPWATLIMTGAKDVENRLWHTNFRGRIAIHSSKKMDPQETLSAARLMAEFIPGFSVDKFCIEAKLKPELYPCGHILGTVEISGCSNDVDSPWFVGEYGFMLRDPRPLQRPLMIKGALGFWEVPADIEQEMVRQLESSVGRA